MDFLVFRLSLLIAGTVIDFFILLLIGQTCVYSFRSCLIGLDILLPTVLIELLPIFKSCVIFVSKST